MRGRPERFTLTVEVPRAGGIAPIARLKAFLKLALRCWGIRCRELREVQDAPR